MGQAAAGGLTSMKQGCYLPSQLSRWPCMATGVQGWPVPLLLPLALLGDAAAAVGAAVAPPRPAASSGRSCISRCRLCAASRAARPLASSAERTLSNQGCASAWRGVMRWAGS